MSGHMYHDSCDTNDDKHQPPTPPTDENVSPRTRLRSIEPPTDHCASDCCAAYPRLHVHGDHDEWNELVAAIEREASSPALDVDFEKMRMDRGWPTPNHMRHAADALDQLVYPRYGDVLRWMADACDARLSTPEPDPAGLSGEEPSDD